MSNMSNSNKTPRPTPKFYDETLQEPFSTKSKLKTRRMRPPPAARTAPFASRVCARRYIHQRPHAITFKQSQSDVFDDEQLLSSRYYDESRQEAYFKQCFEVIERLGAGSFGEVYRVRAKEDGREYAVKRALTLFRSEADRHDKLSEVQKHEQIPPHTNLVRFVRAWEERGRLYIQTELCARSLHDLGQQLHPVPEATVWKYSVDLLCAVKHLHDHNLVHADIKPENIFITADDICKLGDFGLVTDVNMVDGDYPEGDCKYMAPELLHGEFGKPADIFSLGMTLLEMATDLDTPAHGHGWQMLRQNEFPVQFLSTLSPAMRSMIESMLQSSPPLRPTADSLLQKASIRLPLISRSIYYNYRHIVNCAQDVGSTLWLYISVWAACALSCLCRSLMNMGAHWHRRQRVGVVALQRSACATPVNPPPPVNYSDMELLYPHHSPLLDGTKQSTPVTDTYSIAHLSPSDTEQQRRAKAPSMSPASAGPMKKRRLLLVTTNGENQRVGNDSSPQCTMLRGQQLVFEEDQENDEMYQMSLLNGTAQCTPSTNIYSLARVSPSESSVQQRRAPSMSPASAGPMKKRRLLLMSNSDNQLVGNDSSRQCTMLRGQQLVFEEDQENDKFRVPPDPDHKRITPSPTNGVQSTFHMTLRITPQRTRYMTGA